MRKNKRSYHVCPKCNLPKVIDMDHWSGYGLHPCKSGNHAIKLFDEDPELVTHAVMWSHR